MYKKKAHMNKSWRGMQPQAAFERVDVTGGQFERANDSKHTVPKDEWLKRSQPFLESSGLLAESEKKGILQIPMDTLMNWVGDSVEDANVPTRKYQIHSAHYDICARVGYAKMICKYRIQTLVDGWSAIKLMNNKVAIDKTSIKRVQEASIQSTATTTTTTTTTTATTTTTTIATTTTTGKGEIACFAVLGEGNQGQGLICNRRGEYDVVLEVFMRYSTPRETSLLCNIPKAVKNVLVFTIQGHHLEIKVDPILSKEEIKGKGDPEKFGEPASSEQVEQTQITCRLPPKDILSIQWAAVVEYEEEKKEEEEEEEVQKEELPLTITSSQYTSHFIGEGVLTTFVSYQFKIQNAAVGWFRIAIDPRVQILNVNSCGSNASNGVKRHLVLEPKEQKQEAKKGATVANEEEQKEHDEGDVGDDDDDLLSKHRILKIFLEHPQEESYELQITTEMSLKGTSCDIDLPIFFCVGTEINREVGQIGIEARTNVEVSYLESRGLQRIDTTELGQILWDQAQNPLILGYKFIDPEIKLKLEVKKHDDVAVLIAVVEKAHVIFTLTEEGRLGTNLIAQVRNTQKQFLRIGAPKNIDIWTTIVGGEPKKPAKDKDGMVMIPLKKSNSSGNQPQSFSVKFVYLQNPACENDKKQETKETKQESKGKPESKNQDKDYAKLNSVDEEPDLFELQWSETKPMSNTGKLEFTLPAIDLPCNHLFVTLNLPKGFNYGEFQGDLNECLNFNYISSPPTEDKAPRTQVASHANFNQVQQMQQISNVVHMERKMRPARQQARAASAPQAKGVLPVRIDMPGGGVKFLFEELLVKSLSQKSINVKYKRTNTKGCCRQRSVNACRCTIL